MLEIWRDIPQFEGIYQASNLGKIKRLDCNISTKNEKILNENSNSRRVALSINGKTFKYAISKLVYSAFNNEFDYNDKTKIICYKNKNISQIDRLENLYVKDIKKTRSVICITTNKRFNSVIDAGEYYGIPVYNIIRNLDWNSKSAGKLKDGTKLVWMYSKDYEQSSKEEIELKLHNTIKTSQTNSRRVFCITTGKEFESIAEASEFYSIKRGNICNVCNGKKKTTGILPDGTKLVWTYLDK